MNPIETKDGDDEGRDARAERLDSAVAGRLARLRSMPVDVSALRRAVEAETGMAAARRAAARPLLLRWVSPMRAAAASLLVAGLVIALVIASASGPVVAAPDRMADLHQTLVAGDAHVQTVRSVEAANAFFAARNPGGPAVPGMPDEHVMACCVHHLGPTKMSCVSLMADGGVPISLAVADAADVKTPASSETTVVDGVTYHVQSAKGVQMVMGRRGDRWVCLMGEVPTAQLVQLARSLRF